MYAKSLTIALIGLASTTLGAPAPDNDADNFLSSHPTNGHCKDYTITNTVTSTNQIWTYPKFSSNYDVAAHLFNTTQSYRTDAASGAIGYNPFGGKPKEVTAKYTLKGTFCRPKKEKGGKEKTVLLATHGLGYDRRYWASSLQPEKYSFVRAALEEGYSVFYYDRLGTGKSQKISGYENQLEIQVALLKQLATDIRGGKWTDTIKAEKLALVGHSFGSSVSAGVIGQDPTIAEALVLTGFAIATDPASSQLLSTTPSIFGNRIATPSYPDRDSGYLMFSDMYSHIETFFHGPNYEHPVAAYAHSISNPAAVGEFLTLFPDFGRSAEFKGKLWIGSGAKDLILCSGNCDIAFEDGAWMMPFENAKKHPYTLEDAGHGMNFHKNTPEFYRDVFEFVRDL